MSTSEMADLRSVDSRVYRLVAPHEFEVHPVVRELKSGHLVVRPTCASVCAADVRYYTGNRRPDALRKKLPMALIHEAVGIVEEPAGSDLVRGQRVVLVPNIPGYLHSPERFPDQERCCRACHSSGVGENHCENVRFLSSGHDGFLSDRVVHPVACTVPIPDDVPDEIAVLSELLSVAYNAIKRLGPLREDFVFAVFGDGPVGYLTALLADRMFGLGKDRLFVIGIDDAKLAAFDFASVHNVAEDASLTSIPGIDVAFECVGGAASTKAINDAIAHARAGAQLFLMGVSEDMVPINTRDVLEKGISLRGVSRSPRQDYPIVLEMMRDLEFQALLSRSISSKSHEFCSIESLSGIFQHASRKNSWGKTVFGINLPLSEN